MDLAHLPTEVRGLIVDHVASVGYIFDDRKYFAGTFEHIPDIKSLRLSCRAFAGLGCKYLFNSVWLFMTDKSFDSFRKIASAPGLAKHVRRLKIFWTLLDTPTVADGDFYGQVIRRARSESPVAHRVSWTAIDSLKSQHKRLHAQIGDLLAQHLSQFSRLIQVEPGAAWEVLQNSKARSIKTGTIQRHVRETGLPPYFEGWHRNLYDGRQLYDLFRAMAASGCQVQKLVLFTSAANMSSDFLDFPTEMLEIAQKVASGLTEVRLRLESRVLDDAMDWEMLDVGHVPRFLNWLVKMERLCLQTSINLERVDLGFLIPPSVLMPCLRDLELYRVDLHLESLVSIMQQHRNTLKSISIVETVLKSGAWRDVFDVFKYQPGIRRYYFENNYVSQGTATPMPVIHVSRTTLEDQMDEFVFEGADWPEEGFEDFEIEAFG